MVPKHLYQVGQYISRPDTLWLKICGVTGEKDNSVYAVKNPQEDHLHWMTQCELTDGKWITGEPDWLTFAHLTPGDMLHMGSEGSYVKVLVVQDDAVLISESPSEAAGAFLEMQREIKEHFGDGANIMSENTAERMKEAKSSHKAFKRAGTWYTAQQLALFNWQVVKDSHDVA